MSAARDVEHDGKYYHLYDPYAATEGEDDSYHVHVGKRDDCARECARAE